jgi:hypothetical protein
MSKDEKMDDPNYCLRKSAEYSAKAHTAADPKIIASYHAVAREYAYRALLLKEKKKA